MVGESTDQRGAGFTRPVDFPAIAPVSGGNDTDIGSFELQRRTVTVNRSGSGSGAVQASGIDCGGATPDCDEQFAEGQVVTLIATEDPGSQPVVWSGCDSVNGSNECVVTLSTEQDRDGDVQRAAGGARQRWRWHHDAGSSDSRSDRPARRGARQVQEEEGQEAQECKKKAAALPV